MCQWHMLSTNRSEAEMRKRKARSNPGIIGFKIPFDPNII